MPEERTQRGIPRRTRLCDNINSTLIRISNLAKKHCDVKEDECKEYCHKYCDHFSSNYNAYYWAYCPPNRTEGLLPTNKDIDEYLEKFVANENCRES